MSNCVRFEVNNSRRIWGLIGKQIGSGRQDKFPETFETADGTLISEPQCIADIAHFLDSISGLVGGVRVDGRVGLERNIPSLFLHPITNLEVLSLINILVYEGE